MAKKAKTKKAKKAKRQVGRKPCLVKPHARERLVEAVRKGANNKTAALVAGFSETTFYDYARQAEDAEKKEPEERTDFENELLDLMENLEKARAEFKMKNIGIIQEAAEGGQLIKAKEIFDRKGKLVAVEKYYSQPQWTASATLLERLFPDEFGRRDRVEGEVKHTGEVKHSGTGGFKLSGLSKEERHILLEEIRAEKERRRIARRVGEGDSSSGLPGKQVH